MTDENELQTEIDRLKAKNQELIDEKRKAVAASTEYRNQAERLQGEIDNRDQAPITDVFKTLAARDGFSGYLKSEFDRSFTIGKDDDGNLTICDHEGNAIETATGDSAFTPDNVKQLARDRQIDGMNSLIRAENNSGGGSNLARPGHSTYNSTTEKTEETLTFGLK